MSWTTEERFLLHAAARGEVPFPSVRDIQPQRLLDIALKEGMAGFAYRNFKGTGFPPHFSEAIQQAFERAYFGSLAANMRLQKEGLRLLGLFSESGIPVLLLQGFSLLDVVYEDYGLRPLSDMDLLLPGEFFPKARDVLAKDGFESPPHFPGVFLKERLQLDLHEDIMNVARIEGRKDFAYLRFEDLEKYAVRLPEWQGAYRLRPEANFPLLAAHLVKHSFTRLIWFVDLFRILTMGEEKFDPEEMMKIAEGWNLLPSSLIPVLLAQECLGFALPPCLEASISRLALRKNFFCRQVLNNRRSQGMGNFFVASQMGGGWAKARFLWEFCFPRREVMAQIYPQWEKNPGISYVLRFFDLTAKTIAGVFKK